MLGPVDEAIVMQAVVSAGLNNGDHEQPETEEVMVKPELTPEGEVIAAYGAALSRHFRFWSVAWKRTMPWYPGNFRMRFASRWRW